MRVRTTEALDWNVVSLNAAAACLWELLKWPHTVPDLEACLIEAGVTRSRAVATQIVASVMGRLTNGSFVAPAP